MKQIIKHEQAALAYALSGIYNFIRKEYHAIFHAMATISILAMSLFFSINSMELVAILLCIAMVWLTEMLNTAIEKSIDFVSGEKQPAIKYIKDVAAGAVLISAAVSVIIGCIIFIPKIYYYVS